MLVPCGSGGTLAGLAVSSLACCLSLLLLLSWFCFSGDFFLFLGLTKVPFGDYFLFF